MRTCTIERLPIEKGVIRNFPKVIQKHLCQSPFFNTIGGSVLQKYKCFYVRISVTRTPILT